MAHRRHLGFTLVELLVVITIIGMLMALLLPAINSVRENARRTQCSNNMRQIATAMFTYVSSKDVFPGYRWKWTGAGGQPLPASWFVAIAPQLEQSVIKDRYDVLRANPTQLPYVEFMVCPSDPPEQLGPNDVKSHLAYVVNAGRRDIQHPKLPPDHEANGVFHDLWRHAMPKVTIPLKDGNGNTLMLSENINATRWNEVSEPEITFVFLHDPQSFDANGEPKPQFQEYRINQGKNDPAPIPRPSSNHPGGVNVAFCDARTMFLRETIDYRVLQQLMTPDGYNPACDVPGNANDPRTPKGYILNAADYTSQ